MQIYNIHVSVCNSTRARNTVEHVVCMFYVRLLKGMRGVGRGVGSLTSVFCYPYALSGVVCVVLTTAVGWVYSRKNICVKLKLQYSRSKY